MNLASQKKVRECVACGLCKCILKFSASRLPTEKTQMFSYDFCEAFQNDFFLGAGGAVITGKNNEKSGLVIIKNGII